MSGWIITGADPGAVSALARAMGGRVQETERMPVLHTAQEDGEFVAGLLGSHRVRVVRRGADRLGFLARQGGQSQVPHVVAGSRGPGVGKALLDDIKAAGPTVELWTFQADDRAIPFGDREGFCEATGTDGRGNDERLPDVPLIWRRPA